MPVIEVEKTEVEGLVVEIDENGEVTLSYADPVVVPLPDATLDLEADNLASGTTDVATWEDASGNDYDFAQATVSKQPDYTANAINGLPAVSFDGVDDEMERAGGLFSGTAGSLYYLYKSLTPGSTQYLFVAYGGDFERGVEIYLHSSGLYFDIYDELQYTSLSVPLPSANSWHLIELHANGSAYSIVVDGVEQDFEVSEGSDDGKWIGNVGEITASYIGGFFDDGYSGLSGLVAILRTFGPLTSAEKLAVRQAITDKYDL